MDNHYHTISAKGIEYNDQRHVAFDAVRYTKQACIALIVMFVFFLLWASFAKLSSAAIAPGIIVVESKRKPVQHFEGGIVKQIHVSDGQRVSQGELLITLDASRAEASLFGLRAQWQSDLARLNRLQAELNNLKQIDFDPRLLARKNDAHISSVLNTQTQLFEKRRSLRSGEDKVLAEKVAQATLDLQGLQQRYQADQQSLIYLSEQLTMHEKLLETGNTSKSKLLDLKREYTDLNGSLAELKAKISRAQRAVSEAKLLDTNADYTYAKQLGEEIQQLEKSINETHEAMANAEQILKRVEIRAPQAGIVVGLTVFASQSVVRAGDIIMEIVPQEDLLVVEALLKPEDIDVVYQGLATEVRLSAYNFRRTPRVRGVLTHISADRITDPETGSSAYLATIELNQQDLSQLNDVQLYPGMPAEVMILLNQQTPLDYLLSPLSVSAYKAMREM
ncbi:HlyD family type I secretion periplasmic adaptor subunit [Vibrio sp. LaRot3]|uniref:HlyD family type I secretion periplasmic adaptor subunit n=1 Tax=Vibrio sp. LaRot3 TaxID=2998829 RepID=UPI0022CDF936|nr:HlyD family type I secretion periplasmic adaptor subunit [Vibrio sp. LaRot3]MDA0147263.1 HlyD family type I secretion periplasmic adaptor subunit [Vibrio sp. LaRot3]